MPDNVMPSVRTRVVREPDRGVYDRETLNRILDEGFLCHVGFVLEGQPYVIPTSYGRDGDVLYIHGSAASRMLRNLSGGIPVCITVTLLDGLVLARSIFNHSMNYRSAVILGTATLVDHPDEKELRATAVLRIAIEEFSSKVRTGPPIDDEPDYTFPTWAGVIPLQMESGAPIPDARCGLELPEYLRDYRRTE